MSIIYDALKKIENEGQASDSGQENQAKQFTPESKVSVPQKKKTLLLVTILLVSLGVFLFSYKDVLKKVIFTKNKKVNKFGKVSRVLGFGGGGLLTADPKTKKYRGYALEGIIYGIGDSSAIINGRVLRKSDKIDDFVIREILQDSVKLINIENNQALTLELLP